MNRSLVARLINPWAHRRAQLAEQVQALRSRDGDACTRCRRPMRFDRPAGHDLGPRIETIVPAASGAAPALDNQCRCHGRCNGVGADNTVEVLERIRRQNEADLFANARKSANG